MSDKNTFALSRRQLIGGIGAVGAASAGAGLGTTALFSDEESFETNSITAGELDLVVDYFTSRTKGQNTDSNDGRIDGNPGSYSYSVGDVKPGDSGTLAFCPKVVDNPGHLWIGSVAGVTDDENGQTEPESHVDASGSLGSSAVGRGAGDLSDAIEVTVSYAGSVDYDAGSDEITCNDTRELNNPSGYTLADLAKDLESGFRLDGNEPDGGDGTVDAYPASAGPDDQAGPCLCIEWELPATVGNEVQSDSIDLSFQFAAVQERNNDSPDNPFVDAVVGPSDDLQSVVDSATGNDLILLEAGTHETTLDITTDGLTIKGAEGASVTVKPQSTIDWGSRTAFPGRTTSVRVVGARDVTFQNLTFDFADVDAITGVLFWDSTGTICESTLKNTSNPDSAVDLMSYLGTTDSGPFSPAEPAVVDIRDNTFEEVGRIGINIEDFVHADVVGNSFSTTDAGYGIEVGSESTAVIRNNVIEGFSTFFGDGSEPGGIYVENAFSESPVAEKDVVIEGNEISDSAYGVAVGNEFDGLGADVDIDVVLRNNSIHDNSLAGVFVTDEDAQDSGSSVTVRGSGNEIYANEYGYRIGMTADSAGSGTLGDGDVTVDLTGESITDNDAAGINLFEESGAQHGTYSVAVDRSNIESNGVGVENTIGRVAIDATDNWWGASSGPSGGATDPDTGTAASGSGDSITGSGDVRFDPFATGQFNL